VGAVGYETRAVLTRRVVGLLLVILASLAVGSWAADQDGDLSTADAMLAVAVEDVRAHDDEGEKAVDGRVTGNRAAETRRVTRARRPVALRFAILLRRWHRAFLGDVPI
jgi:hypothetical protein